MTALQSSPSLASLLAPELLQEVLSQLPLRTVAAAATTCQGWKELALDILWKDVDLVDLLNVLAPTEERRRDDYGLALVSKRFLIQACSASPIFNDCAIACCSISSERSRRGIGQGSITWRSGFGEGSSTHCYIPLLSPNSTLAIQIAPDFFPPSLMSTYKPKWMATDCSSWAQHWIH